MLPHQQRSPLLLLSILALASCSDSGGDSAPPAGGGGGGGTPNTQELKVFSNAGDARILAVEQSAGPDIVYYGNRDTAGLPVDLYAVNVQKAIGVERFELNPQGLPEVMRAANGERYELGWDMDAQSATLTAISPDGTFQISTEVSFVTTSGLAASDGPDGPAWSAPRAISRMGQRVTGKVVHAGIDANSLPNLQLGSAGTSENQVLTLVSLCGVEAQGGYNVFTSVRDQATDELLFNVPAVYQGGGLYAASLPTSGQIISNTPETCGAIGSALQLSCDSLGLFGGADEVSTKLCAALEAAITAIGGDTPGSGVYGFDGCAGLLASMQLYCQALAVPQGHMGLSEMLCDATFEDVVLPDQVRIQSCILTAPENLCSTPATVNVDGGLPLMNAIDLGTDSAIQSLTLVPSAPAAGQSYVANARITCIPAMSMVTLSIVGTDGYTDDISFPVVESTADATYQLGVPGAAQGVQDTVTADLMLPGGEVQTRTAFLVFGN